jgi:hypothetical protein
MRTLWMFHRRLVVVVATVVVLIVSTGVVVVSGHRNSDQTAVSAEQRPGHRSAVGRSGTPINVTTPRHLVTSPTIDPPQTAVQRQVDSALAQAETPAAIDAAEAANVPAAAVSVLYPSIPTEDRDDPTAYALAFANELLDTNYAAQSRSALLAWAEHEEAPNTLPGVPASVAGKALVLSLADPGLPGGTPSPTPSAAIWASDQQSGVSQTVSNLQAEIDPDWTEIVSEGWQPRDPLMTIETVTGTMSVTTKGQVAPPQSFSLTLTLGSAAHVHAGYGAVAAGNWTVN